MKITTDQLAAFGDELRKTIADLLGRESPHWTSKHSPTVWAEIKRLLDIYAEKARAIGADPDLLAKEPPEPVAPRVEYSPEAAG